MSKLTHRRSDIEVIADILRLGEARKTEIMYSVNMSYSQLQKYLNLLLQLELVDKTLSSNQSVTYRPAFPISNWGHRQALMVK